MSFSRRLIFFTDENFPLRLANMLKQFDCINEIRPSEDYFDKGTKDIDWMRAVAKWGSNVVIVGSDCGVLKNEVEKHALKKYDLTYVIFKSWWIHLKWNHKAWKTIKIWPDIVKSVLDSRYPTVFEVTASKVQSLVRTSLIK